MAGLSPTHPLVAIPAAAAAALLAWKVIWQQGVVPFWRFCRRLVATLDAIAEEFKPNGGGSMRDAIDTKADKADVLRIENGVIEAIRIGHANNEALASYGQTLDAHLQQTAWHEDRDAVLARLAVMEDRQRRVTQGVVASLRPIEDAGGALGTIVSRVIDSLEDQEGQP